MINITCYVLVILYGVLSVARTQFADREHYSDRHNFGYVLHKVQTMRVITAEAKILFHFQLPLQVTRNVTVQKHFLSFPELTISRTTYIQEIPSPFSLLGCNDHTLRYEFRLP